MAKEEQKGPSLGEKLKEGVSVKEIESFTNKYLTELFIIVAIIVASISSTFDFFMGPGWSIILAGIGAILSIALPDKIRRLQGKLFDFLRKQEKITQIIVGAVRIIVALFLPFIIFLEIGLLAGLAFHHFFKK